VSIEISVLPSKVTLFRNLLFLFSSIEKKRILDICNVKDMFALHFVFRHLIQKSLDEFSDMWDSHKLRTEALTPLQLFTLGIEELKRRSLVNGKDYTELQQFHVDTELVSIIQNHCIKGVRGVQVPRVISPPEDTLCQFFLTSFNQSFLLLSMKSFS
jgi:hypothetical protein